MKKNKCRVCKEGIEEFMSLGEDIAHSRIIGKAHYPSDKKFGKELAEKLFSNLV